MRPKMRSRGQIGVKVKVTLNFQLCSGILILHFVLQINDRHVRQGRGKIKVKG